MTKANLAVVVLAAGKGKRMASDVPKVLHPLAGRPMVGYVLAAVDQLRPRRSVVVIGPNMDELAAAVAPHATAVQKEAHGTAHAVLAARKMLEDFTGDVLVLYGDTPMIGVETLNLLIERRHRKPQPAIVVLGFQTPEPGEYGRLVTTGADELEAIVEYQDATITQRAINLCNSGVMAIDGRQLWPLIDRVGNRNAKGEYYLTDIVGLARRQGLQCAYVKARADELLGINSRAELAAAEAAMQRQLRARAMAGGATLIAPETVWLAHDTRLGRDVTIGPNVYFGPGVEIQDRVEIRGFCHIEGARIGERAIVGPFARLRPGADIGRGAHIGNFVEVKNATVEEGAKANHLTYLGDAWVGAGANIGAGTITCNYDGFDKHATEIGKGAFIGSNTALVAPVKVGDGAIVGAGSVITRDVSPDALALERARQGEVPGWAAEFRAQKRAAKAARKAPVGKPPAAKPPVAKPRAKAGVED
ncbi:MAG TPA: bifunctional UDP-N-acetylglucosamine diphosphorylase/glucosamine-1-phosphate N-acetyltransferase GlmU [Alphaproteobacteria bacterium]|nr:bifunctional UDP-N-acetylglucosamine diphosphorylase/glucosamine-1-phosphate N-acetyltransferase GlmU [Alphaproteobacteria bacterium]